ncbi:phosphatase 2C-like domain-containing protein [Ochromonadaceae sp. CCMP2298]|nr:phosphatase 2C-like domain-containing protein [Ochromonadaceae sp. CCMP2298]
MSKEPPRNSNGWWFSAGQPPAPPATTSIGIEQPTILAVFDGHGGGECSRFLTQEFPALFEGASSRDDPLSSALLAVDERFACSPANHGRVGSTATVLSIDSQFLRCASAGDSRAILIRKGTVVDLSSDHSPDLRPDEISRIEIAGGMLSRGGVLTQALFYLATRERPCLRVYHRSTGEGGLNMTRAIGDSYLKPLVIATPELTCIPRHRDDAFVVLASDGLWDVLTSQETAALIGVLQSHGDDADLVSQAAWALVVAAQKRGSTDNISVMVARMAPTL